MRIVATILLGIALGTMGQSALAECVTKPGHQLDSDTRLRAYFKSCLRIPMKNERRLYTWGHKDKLALLKNHPYAEFSLYNTVQQDAFAGAQARKSITVITKKKDVLDKFIRYLNSIYGTNNVADLWRFSRSAEHLSSVQNLWRQASMRRPERYRMPLDSADEVDMSKLFDQTIEAQTGFRVLAFEQITPGFIASLNSTTKARIELLEGYISQAKKNKAPLAPLSIVRGELLGLKRSLYQNEDSNISFGPAVYFSTSPVTYLNHFKASDHMGLVCELNKKARIVDIFGSVAKSTLLEGGVYLRNAAGDSFTYPTGYNEVSNPRHIRLATNGLLIRNSNTVYSDNGVINYSACKTVNLNHIKSCKSIVSLLGNSNFLSTSKGALYSYFATQAGDLQKQTYQLFIDRIEMCVKEQAKAPDQKFSYQRMCERLTDDDFKSSDYFKENKRRLTEIDRLYCKAEAR